MAQIDLRNATFRIKDGSSTPNYIVVKIGEGSLDHTERRTIDPVDSRGVLDTMRLGKEIPMDVSFQFIWEYITASSAQPATVEDALKRVGAASGWVSTSPDPNAPYCVDLQLDYIPPCRGGDEESTLFPQFHYLELAHSLKDGTVAARGICNSTRALPAHTTRS